MRTTILTIADRSCFKKWHSGGTQFRWMVQEHVQRNDLSRLETLKFPRCDSKWRKLKYGT